MEINFVLGLVVGLILALTGAGGGILAVPLLVFGAHLSIAQAGPIGLLAVGIAAALGALLGLRAGAVRYKAAALVAVCGMALTPFGLWLAQRVPNQPLTLLFALVLLGVALRMLQQAFGKTPPAPAVQPACCLNPAVGRFVWTWPCARRLAAAGMLTGWLSGLLGVGGGFVMVPALRRFTDLEQRAIVATSLAVIALVSLTGVIASAVGGTLAWPVAQPFAAGAVLGMLGGRKIGAGLDGRQLQIAFALVAMAVALGLAVKALA
jgi:uncharacterized membrane protein YfcA